MAKEITMKDIAKKLGISTVSVSKALTGKAGVSDEVRNQILKAAEEMGYIYSATKSGKLVKKFNIGVLVDERYIQDQNSNFYFKMYQHIIMQLSPLGYSAFMEIITEDMVTNEILPQVVLENKVDGLIAMGKIDEGYLQKIRETAIPVVYLDYYDENMDVPSVITDNVYGTYILTNYLINLGHRKIAYLGDIYATPSILDRYLGYQRAFMLNNLPYNPDYCICDRDKKGDYIDFKLPADMPTAFVCNCDDIAAVLIDKLNNLGYRVPEDISVVGFDNSMAAEFTNPKLTTMEVDMTSMTFVTCDILEKMISGVKDLSGRRVISGHLIERDSVRRLT